LYLREQRFFTLDKDSHGLKQTDDSIGEHMKYLVLLLTMMLLTSCISNNELHYLPAETEAVQQAISDSVFEYTYVNDKPTVNPGTTFMSLGKFRSMEDNIYYYNGGYVVYRINSKTGNVTTVCNDPLCFHKTESCPFYGFFPGTMYYVHKNMIHYTQRYTYPVEEYGKTVWKEVDRKVRFDIKKQKLSIVRDYVAEDFESYMIISELYYEDYYYYLNNLVDENDSLYFQLCRDNLTTGKTEVIKELGNTAVSMMYVDSDKLFYTYGTHVCYCYLDDPYTEYDLIKHPYQEAACDGEAIYCRVKEGDIHKVYRLDIESGEEICLVDEDTNYIFLTEKYLYYSPNNPLPYGQTKAVQNSNTIYRYEKATGTTECVFTLPKDMDEEQYWINRYFLVDGNYIYTTYAYEDKESGIAWHSNDEPGLNIMRINTENGEIAYITYEE